MYGGRIIYVSDSEQTFWFYDDEFFYNTPNIYYIGGKITLKVSCRLEIVNTNIKI